MPGRVPNCQSEHSVHAFEEFDAILLVEMNQRFGVARGFVNVPLANQFGAYRTLVIKFAVIRNPDGAIFVRHRLATTGDIDDREAAMSQCAGAVEVEAIAIGASMGDSSGHPFDDGAVSGAMFSVDESSDSAHRKGTLLQGRKIG